jgi:hypothetical protein
VETPIIAQIGEEGLAEGSLSGWQEARLSPFGSDRDKM